MGIQEVIRPYARRLHQKYHEVVNVSILEHNPGDVYHSVIILKEMSDQQLLTVNPPVGSSVSAIALRLENAFWPLVII